jgi:ParB-like chromosome segregation protein Spo0J
MPMPLNTILPNPNNPRLIKDEKFKKLVQSIRDFPEMMSLRPLIIDENNYTLGGNMRRQALVDLGYDEIPDEWVKKVTGLTEDQKREFIIKDNLGYGEWDWEELANSWDNVLLDNWGLDIPDWKQVNEEENEPNEKDQELQWFVNVRCNSEEDCQKLYANLIEEGYDVKIIT